MSVNKKIFADGEKLSEQTTLSVPMDQIYGKTQSLNSLTNTSIAYSVSRNLLRNTIQKYSINKDTKLYDMTVINQPKRVINCMIKGTMNGFQNGYDLTAFISKGGDPCFVNKFRYNKVLMYYTIFERLPGATKDTTITDYRKHTETANITQISIGFYIKNAHPSTGNFYVMNLNQNVPELYSYSGEKNIYPALGFTFGSRYQSYFSASIDPYDYARKNDYYYNFNLGDGTIWKDGEQWFITAKATKNELKELFKSYGVSYQNGLSTPDDSNFDDHLKDPGTVVPIVDPETGEITGETTGDKIDDLVKDGKLPQYEDDYDPYQADVRSKDPSENPDKTITAGDKGGDDPTGVGDAVKSADENNKLPTINLFNRTFALTVGQVRSLADELWNADDTRFEEIKNGLALMGGNPIQGLIDLRLYPIDFGSWAGANQSIVVGRTSLDTQGRLIETNTLPQFSCSLGTIRGQYGNFMDYEPFSIFQIYLPFVGTTDIPANLVIGHEISCKASVDIITGAISYIVKADGYPILYKNGTIGVSIPMTADNAAEYALGVIHATNNMVQTGADAVKTVAKDVAKATSVKGAITDPSSNVAGAVSAGADIVAGASAIATAGVDLSTTVNQTTIQQSGTASPSNSLYTSMAVYILQEYHNPVIPTNYAHDIGVACRLSGSVGSFSGYTQFSNVDLTGINCTESERTIILETLQNGVYL